MCERAAVAQLHFKRRARHPSLPEVRVSLSLPQEQDVARGQNAACAASGAVSPRQAHKASPTFQEKPFSRLADSQSVGQNRSFCAHVRVSKAWLGP